MKQITLARFNPWASKRSERLEQYLETERHEWMDAIDLHRTECTAKEKQIDLELLNEKRTGRNLLENREIRVSALVVEYQRTLIEARIGVRQRLGMECPELLSDVELSKLKDGMLRSLHAARQSRRQDYQCRARSAGVPLSRPEGRDTPAYANLGALVQREIRKLSLARSLRRTGKATGKSVGLVKKIWFDPVWSKVIATALAALGTSVCAYLLHRLWSALHWQ